ncbi:MAG TPA: WD40 repeat domain-containing serine/threonine protein kinase [Verrucomicrobiae bacterium]|nr:WD40 repeat domain-containing serine/threonine protein kinase [Verrucomicrobiae bacterium]
MMSDNPGAHDAMRAALEQRLGEPDASPQDRPPQVADHALICIIGRGAYGEVWLARNALGRPRAVKIVYRSRFKEERPYQRELDGILKYEPVSRSHPGLVQVLQVGRDDAAACFYYVMELADPVAPRLPESPSSPADEPSVYAPRTLRSDLAERRRWPPVDSAHLALRLAGALGHLHARGLVHRDIKPSNVIFVEGQPKLADIGLVTDVGNATSFVGTEGFIPPEGPGTPQADLFGLGKLLYEMATGRDRLDFPQLPAALGETPEAEALLDLNEVMARACAPNVKLRYATASELEADLRLFLAGHSLRQVRSVERTLTRIKRQALVASILAVTALGAFLFAQRQNQLAEARAAAEAALRTRAEAAEARARRQLHEALLEQARANSRSGELGQRTRTLDAVRRAGAIANNADLRREAFAALVLPDLLLERKIPLRQRAFGWAFDPNFERYAIGESNGPIQIRSVSDQSLLLSLPAVIDRDAHVLEWSPDGRHLAVKRDLDRGGQNAELEVWDLEKVQRVLHARGEPTLNAMSFHPSRPRLMTARSDGRINEWNLESARPEHQFQIPAGPFSLRYAPDGQRIAVSYDLAPVHRVDVYDAATGRLLAQKSCPASVMMLDWHPQGQWIAAPDYAGNVHLIDPSTGQSRVLGSHRAQGAHAAFCPDGNFLITGGWENALICWNIQTYQRALNIDIPSYELRFRPHGPQCAARTQDGIQIYQFQQARCERDLAGELGRPVTDAAFSPNGRWLAIHGDQGIGLWNAQRSDPRPASFIPVRDNKIPLFSPDSSELYSFWEDSLRRWRLSSNADTNADTAPQVQALPSNVPKGFRTASFAGPHLVFAGTNGVQLLDWPEIERGARSETLKPAGRGKASPDGRWFATYKAQSPVLHILQLPELTFTVSLTNQADVWTLAFSSRSDELAVATRTELTFFEVGTWKITRRLEAGCIRQCSVLYQPDGRSFWFTPDGRSAALYDARSLAVLLPLPNGTIPLAVSPDGRQLAALVDATRLQLWDMQQVRQALRELGVDWAN